MSNVAFVDICIANYLPEQMTTETKVEKLVSWSWHYLILQMSWYSSPFMVQRANFLNGLANEIFCVWSYTHPQGYTSIRLLQRTLDSSECIDILTKHQYVVVHILGLQLI